MIPKGDRNSTEALFPSETLDIVIAEFGELSPRGFPQLLGRLTEGEGLTTSQLQKRWDRGEFWYCWLLSRWQSDLRYQVSAKPAISKLTYPAILTFFGRFLSNDFETIQDHLKQSAS